LEREEKERKSLIAVLLDVVRWRIHMGRHVAS